MGSARRRQSRQQRRSLARRRAKETAAERKAQQQAAATPSWSGRRRRRLAAAYTLWGIAVVIAISHFFEHAGMIRLMAPTFEDLAIGWPMAFVVGVAGYVLYNR